MNVTRLVAAAFAVALAGGALPAFAQSPQPTPSPNPQPTFASSQALRSNVKLRNVRAHQEALQAIADANGGTRADSTPGFTASADYVTGLLEAAGYKVSRPDFEYSVLLRTVELEQVAPTARVFTFGFGADFFYSSGGGNGTVTAPVTAVDIHVYSDGANEAGVSTSGCELEDFYPNRVVGDPSTSLVFGKIALVQRGVCNFSVKVDNAQQALAAGVIIMNEGNNPTRTAADVFPNVMPQRTFPVLFSSYSVGRALLGAGVVVRMHHDAVVEDRTSENVIADSPWGDPNNVVVVGAHLDSVDEGPGINDNGSGTAVNLEVAIQMAKLGQRYANKVRFAFWGAEEWGLVGSTRYVEQLAATSDPSNPAPVPPDPSNPLAGTMLDRILLNLNFDMVGSPNFVRFIYDGNGDGAPNNPVGPAGSAEIEQVFAEYFASRNLETEPTPFNGRSDYGPFITRGIPAGGLFTGAEGRKTAAQALIYGGMVGEQYDPCYHAACDTIENNSDEVLDQMADAVAHSVSHFAQRTHGPIADRTNRRPVDRDALPFWGNEARR
jgi:Zn-dependent M28 family amino/carboxypeptidase